MLLLLNELLNTNLLRLRRNRINGWVFAFASYYMLIIRNRGDIFMIKDLWFYIPLFILVNGYLNNPYRRFINSIRVYINKKLFKRKFVVRNNGLITFTNNKKGFPKSLNLDKDIIGIVCGNTVYLDEYCKHINIKCIQFNGMYNIIYYEGLSTFLIDTEFESMDDIEKKLVVFRLGIRS